METKTKVIRCRDKDDLEIWRIVIDGVEHPAQFRSEQHAFAQLGLLRSRGFQEGARAA